MWRARCIAGWHIVAATGILTPMSGLGTYVGMGPTPGARCRIPSEHVAGSYLPTRSSGRWAGCLGGRPEMPVEARHGSRRTPEDSNTVGVPWRVR